MKSALLWILCFTYEITFIFSDLSSITSCSDPRWKLKTNDGLWNSPVNIWTIRNVSIVPSQNTHFVNVNTNIPMNSLGEVQNSIKNCGGIHDHRIGKPVFLNCPCEYDEVLGKGIQADKSNLCPGSLSLRGSGLTAQLPVVRRSRDLLLIFNTWGGSPYHVIVESILPAWITVQILIRQLNFPVNSMTLLNLGAFCPSNKHSEIRPLIEALFGNGTYEDSTGTQSGSFSDTAPTHYELLVYGFHHSLSPLSGNRRKVDFNDEIGKFVLEFSQTLKANLLSINELSGGSIFRDTDKSRESSLNNAVLSSKISPVPIAANISAFDVNTSKTWWHDKKSFPRIAFTKRTRRDDRYIESLEDIIQTFSAAGLNVSLVEFGGLELPTYNAQAAYTAGVDVLVGAEGGPVLVSDCGLRLQTNMRPLQSAGHIQQLFMPLNSILVLLHLPKSGTGRKTGDIGWNRWHEAVAHYLGHTVLNLECSDLKEQNRISGSQEWDRITSAVKMIIEMHRSWKSAGQGQFGVCDILNVQSWSPPMGCTNLEVFQHGWLAQLTQRH